MSRVRSSVARPRNRRARPPQTRRHDGASRSLAADAAAADGRAFASLTMSRVRAARLSLALLTLLCAAYSTSTAARQAQPASLDELAKRSLARLDGELRVPGLKEPVQIIRDQQGIPHSKAKNDDDMFFAQGYVMAQDRLWQLEMWRRWREGRLAQIFGSKAYDHH